MPTQYAELQIFGGLVGGGLIIDQARRRDEIRVLEAVTRSLPPEWRPEIGLTIGPVVPAHWVEIPYTSQRDLGTKIASMLVAYDMWFPRALSCNFVLSPLPHGAGTAGRRIYQGDGITLGHAVSFWAGIRWGDVQPLSFSLTDADHELVARLLLAYRRMADIPPQVTPTRPAAGYPAPANQSVRAPTN